MYAEENKDSTIKTEKLASAHPSSGLILCITRCFRFCRAIGEQNRHRAKCRKFYYQMGKMKGGEKVTHIAMLVKKKKNGAHNFKIHVHISRKLIVQKFLATHIDFPQILNYGNLKK